MKFLIALLFCAAAHAAPPAPLVWSPADHSLQVSVNGVQATRSSLAGAAWQGCRSDRSQSVGVRTVLLNIVQVGSSDNPAAPGMWVGVGSGKSSLNDYSGSTDDGVSYDARGRVMKNAQVTTNPPTYTTGDVVGIQVDLDAHTVKFNKNGGAWSAATDITSLGPDVFVTCSLGAGSVRSTVAIASDDWNDYPYTTVNIVAHGDSITLIGGVMQTYLPRLLNALLDNRVAWAEGRHIGINGVSWGFAWVDAGYPFTLIQDAPLRVDPARGPIPNWLIAFAGTNGFALDPDIGAAGQNTNTTWFLDGTHPTDSGHARIAQILYDLLKPYL